MPDRSSHSLRRRLLARLGWPLLIVLALGLAGAFNLARYVGRSAYDNWLYDSALTLAAQLRWIDDKPVLEVSRQAMDMFEWDKLDHIFDEAVSSTGGSFFGNAHFPRPTQRMVLGEPYFYDSVLDGEPVRVVAVVIQRPGNPETVLVQVGETLRKRDQLTGRVLAGALPLAVAVLVMTAILIWLAVTSSLRAVDDIAKRLAKYQPENLVPIDASIAPQEVMPLVQSINDLLARLADMQARERRFVANAAHQLRTPLASLQLQTERALREADPVLHSDALQQVLSALRRLGRLTNQLLTLAQTEQAHGRANAARSVDLAAVARETLEHWIDAAIVRGVDLGYDGPDAGVIIVGEQQLLQEMLGNLIDNAVRYGREGGQVTLGLRTMPIVLTVDDDGSGIPPEEWSAVLERFYRRPGAPGVGSGLGLPIAREIAERHGAALAISSGVSGRGTRITVTFPSG